MNSGAANPACSRLSAGELPRLKIRASLKSRLERRRRQDCLPHVLCAGRIRYRACPAGRTPPRGACRRRLECALRHHHGRTAPRDRKRRRGRTRRAHRGSRHENRDRPAIPAETTAGPARCHPCPRAHQYARARGHVPVPRHCRRYAPAGLAGEIHLSGRSQKCLARIRALGHAPGLSGNAAGRHHHLHRHVLLRGRGGGGHQRSRHARCAGRDHHRLSRPRQQDARRCPEIHRALHHPLSQRSPDRAGSGAARALHQLRRDLEGLARAGQPLRRAAHHSSFGDEEGERRYAGQAQNDTVSVARLARRSGADARSPHTACG